MRLHWVFFVTGVAVCTSMAACNSTDAVLGDFKDPSDDSRVPDAAPADSGLDGASTDAAAGQCADCEYFPEACSSDVLCPNGPFDPNSPAGSLDLRASINVIRGRSVNDVWAAGAVGALAHFDGTSWSLSDLGSRYTQRALWLRDTTEVSLGALQNVYARGVDVPDGGTAPSGGGWKRHSPSYAPELDPSSERLVSVWAAPGADWLWCAAKGVGVNTPGGLWRLRQSPATAFELEVGIPASVCRSAGCGRMASIHGAAANEFWAVGASGATVRVTDAENDAPSVKAFNSQTSNALNGVWAASDSEAWAVGANGTIRHYTGDPMLWDVVSDVPTTVDLNAVWGASSSDVWAVGDAGVVLHYDGKSWSRVKIAGLGTDRPELTTVWVAAPGHVWIGGQGVILSLGGKP
jgi:hypothetical protein